MLTTALADLVDQQWHEREVLAAQRQALAEFDRAYSTVAVFLEATFELGDRDDLARRVRPGGARNRRGKPADAHSKSVRRPGKRPAELAKRRHPLGNCQRRDEKIQNVFCK